MASGLKPPHQIEEATIQDVLTYLLFFNCRAITHFGKKVIKAKGGLRTHFISHSTLLKSASYNMSEFGKCYPPQVSGIHHYLKLQPPSQAHTIISDQTTASDPCHCIKTTPLPKGPPSLSPQIASKPHHYLRSPSLTQALTTDSGPTNGYEVA